MNEFIYPFRIYIEDTDFTGIVYHSNYLKYFERARSEWAEASGYGIEWQRDKGILFAICSIKVDYLKPAYLNQQLEVVTRIKEVRPASMLYDQYLRSRERPDTIICKAEIKIACVDLNLRPRTLPDIIYGEPV